MVYQVELTDRAERDLESLLVQKQVARSMSARRWYDQLERGIAGLARFPERGSASPEARSMGRPLRQVLHGRYRVVYEIHAAEHRVVVLTVRHTARDVLAKEELDEV